MATDKYGRSYHLPNSPGGTRDDKRMADVSGLVGVEIVITEKMDGGNGCLTDEAVYARSHATPTKEWWWSFVKAEHARCRWDIPTDTSVFGENVWPIHSIVYTEPMPGPFLVFNVREDDTGTWLSWDEVVMYAEALDLPLVPVLFRGVVNSIEELMELTDRLSAEPSAYGPTREGVVVRVARSFGTDEFSRCLGKWVRAGHVQTDEHWKANVRPQPCFE